MKSEPEGNEDLVITPGGLRAKHQVHSVNPGESVSFQQGNEGKTMPNRNVPAHGGDRVLTPGGYRPRLLVHVVPADYALVAVERHFQLLNLSNQTIVETPRVTVRPEDLPALGSGWISYAFWNNGTGKTISSFKTNWNVPLEPTTSSSQTVFLFNGIQNYGANFGILQPVLQWGSSAAGGGPYWSIASWYVTSGGQAFHTQLVRVNPGDGLAGIMSLAGTSGFAFNYVCEFVGRPETRLPVQGIAELLWCNETLEAYGMNQCTDYPASQSVSLQAISIDAAGSPPPVVWTSVNAVADCGQHTIVVSNSSQNGEVDIFFRQ